jgi:hypothetical protein
LKSYCLSTYRTNGTTQYYGGVAKSDDKTKISYKVVLKTPLPELTDDEKMLLKDGLVLDPTIKALGNGAVACVRGEDLLKKW